MKKLINVTVIPSFAAMPVVAGLMAVLASPIAGAVTIESVDIIDGKVDVTQSGVISTFDDATDVMLSCDDATQVRVDIIDGFIDLDEDGVTGELEEDLNNCDFTDETAGPAGSNNGIPQRNQVDIINGKVDVNESFVVDAADDAVDIQMLKLP